MGLGCLLFLIPDSLLCRDYYIDNITRIQLFPGALDVVGQGKIVVVDWYYLGKSLMSSLFFALRVHLYVLQLLRGKLS